MVSEAQRDVAGMIPVPYLLRLMRRLSRLSFLILVIATLAGCHSSQPESQANDRGTAQRQKTSASRHDLSQDEEAGGHTLKKHVGRTDDQLRERLAHERNISGASTYTDRDMAERAIGAAIEANADKIQRWLEREGGHPNLVLLYDSDHPIGRTIHRGGDQSEPCSHALVVLKWDEGGKYHVLTSYPEC